MFQKAVKSQSKLRLALMGPSGSGKTYTALRVATAMGKVAMVDTENGSAAKYADEFYFDVMEMDAPYHPDRFIEAIKGAEKAGYDVLILDSLSHAWNGAGGLLEIVDQIAKGMKTSNTFAAWKDATPIQNKLVEAVVRTKIHIIACMRSKQEYIIEEQQRGNRTVSVPRKVGMAPIQRDAFEYEFDIVGDLDLDHNLIVTKTRCRALDNAVISQPGADLAQTLLEWLTDGVEATPSFATLDDFLFQLYEDFKLPKDHALAVLKELGYTGFPKNGEAKRKSQEMYRAVKHWIEATKDRQEADQLGFDAPHSN